MLEVWKVYTVKAQDWYANIELEWVTTETPGNWCIEYFAPYEEECEPKDASTLPVYVTLKDMPYISKGSVIVQRTDWTIVHQANDSFPKNLLNYEIDNLNWLIKEHPEDFRKIN